MANVEVRFPGRSMVEARYKGHSILTAQPEHVRESGVAPSPFDLFLASIATCAGYYALTFCRTREIPTDELAVSLEPVREQGSGRIARLRIVIELPPEFPEKYKRPLLKAVDQCSVKRHILEPPRFEVVTVDSPVPAPQRRSPVG